MADLLIVVERRQDWKSFYPTDNVLTFQEYLTEARGPLPRGTRVLNLCRDYKYLSNGYYCSLLAEARGHRVMPSVRTLNDLGRKAIYGPRIEELAPTLKKLEAQSTADGQREVEVVFHFGTFPGPGFAGASPMAAAAESAESGAESGPVAASGTGPTPPLVSLARQLFEQFPCPILRVTFSTSGPRDRPTPWTISSLRAGRLHRLTDQEEDEFARALDHFSRQIWRQPKSRRSARFELAMLVNPDEQMPPSDERALKRFVKAGRKVGLEVEMIHKGDYGRLAEFDGLFIRETTGIDNHTYRFAKRAESEGLVVIDDAESILRCTNKVYLADLLQKNRVPTPETRILSRDHREDLAAAGAALGFPLVLKIPDGSFSRGVVKVQDVASLEREAAALFKRSALLLAQEFMYTDYDWRIGVLAGKPLFACQYFMSRGHWQIYQHGAGGQVDSGDFRTMPVHEAPKAVVQAAVRAAGLIGQSLYGVDVKQQGKRAVVIEVNDNPNVDAGVEDQFLGDELYQLIMQDFLRRMELRGRK